MKTLFLASALSVSSMALASCSGPQSGDTPAPSASAGQALVGGDPVELDANSPFSATSQATFNEPWAIDIAQDGATILVTEKSGTLKIFRPATGSVQTVSGVPEVAYGGQGGLGDVAMGPDGMLYLSWAKAEGSGYVAAVGRGSLACTTAAGQCSLGNFEQIWQQSRPGARQGHYSHRIEFSPDGRYLFVSSGDRQEGAPAQDLTNNLGGIVRLNLDGTPAAGNPFADRGSPADQMWSYGQRNLLGLDFDANGQLWELEHGPRGGDELNRVDRGANYGWPTRSYGIEYNGTDIPDHTPDDGFSKPAIHWTPVIGPGGMQFYSGGMFGEWQGQLLVANLTTKSIVRIATDAANNRATELGRYAFPNRLRDIAVAPDGAIWVIEDGANGRLMRLIPRG